MLAAVIAVAAAVAAQFAGSSGRGRQVDETLIARQWRDARKRVNALEARLAEITSPASGAIPRLLQAAQASGASGRITLGSVRPRRPLKTASGMQENAIEVQAAGRFPDVVRFMKDIQEKNPQVRLGRVVISSADGASDMVNCTVVVASFSTVEVEK